MSYSLNQFKRGISNQQDIERDRILSDNYIVEIVYYLNNQPNYLDLSQYGLKSFKWEARDETKIFKPCTRKEEIALVRLLGYDLEFTFDKNSADIMVLLMQQNAIYYGANIIKRNQNNNYEYKPTNILLEKRAKADTRTNPAKKTNVLSTAESNFYSKETPNYITPKFDLRITVQHQSTSKPTFDKEILTFKDVKLFKPYQKTDEGSSTIEEGFKGFASIAIASGDVPNIPNMLNFVQFMINEQVQFNVDERTLPQRDRKINNYSNYGLVKPNTL